MTVFSEWIECELKFYPCDDKRSFISTGLAKPGTQIEYTESSQSDRRVALLGDFTARGGGCANCEDHDLPIGITVWRYRFLKEVQI